MGWRMSFALALVAIVGCGGNPAPPATNTPPFEEILDVWTQGNREEAIDAFLKVADFGGFDNAERSILGMPQVSFNRLSTVEQTEQTQRLAAANQQLRQLVEAILEKANSEPPEVAAKMVKQLKKFGAWLQRPEHITSVQQLGKGVAMTAEQVSASNPE